MRPVKFKIFLDVMPDYLRFVQNQQAHKNKACIAAVEVHRLLAECKPAYLSIVTAALNTGMRRGEILKWKREDVDLRNGLLLVKGTKNGESRAVPIIAAVREVLAGPV